MAAVLARFFLASLLALALVAQRLPLVAAQTTEPTVVATATASFTLTAAPSNTTTATSTLISTMMPTVTGTATAVTTQTPYVIVQSPTPLRPTQTSYVITATLAPTGAPSATPTRDAATATPVALLGDRAENNYRVDDAPTIGWGQALELSLLCPVASACAHGDHDFFRMPTKRGTAPRLYTLPGAITANCQLEATTYLAFLR